MNFLWKLIWNLTYHPMQTALNHTSMLYTESLYTVAMLVEDITLHL